MMHISRPVFFGKPAYLAIAAVCFASTALAQSTTSNMQGVKLSGDQPIAIESDQLEIRDQERKAYFTGNVKVVQGTTTLQSGKMTVNYKGEGSSLTSGDANIEKIFVDNNVFLTSGTQKATADHGEFDMAAQTFILTGKQVVLSEGTNVFTGCKLTVLMNTGQAKLESCGGPVRIMLDPKSQQKKQ
ncbi:LptA/OstA family protein [Agrobacterium tumefaciens]|uniref:LptA/OstA family protein n=1 Tax=Agrobacterium tumefaciens TaxID=358 RepID=UPI00287F26A5|nr:LptA/OstA family protein [Agrobacterium tumefaciens]MDS7596006.1 LptA/OstA family protein [Agrobacterium tumefaciens]